MGKTHTTKTAIVLSKTYELSINFDNNKVLKYYKENCDN